MNTELKTREEIFTAMGQGKAVEWKGENTADCWVSFELLPLGLATQYEYRIKPEPKTVPLEMADINLHRDLFRLIRATEEYTVSSRNRQGVWIMMQGYAYGELRDVWERSIDGGETWQRCEKEVWQ